LKKGDDGIVKDVEDRKSMKDINGV